MLKYYQNELIIHKTYWLVDLCIEFDQPSKVDRIKFLKVVNQEFQNFMLFEIIIQYLSPILTVFKIGRMMISWFNVNWLIIGQEGLLWRGNSQS